MAKARVILRGADKLVGNLKTVARKYPEAAMAALFQEGERLRGIVIPLTPDDKGILRGSFFVNRPVATVRGPSVTVGFGGAAAAYALAQHEGPGASSSPPSWANKIVLSYTEPGTGPRFLENGVRELSKDHLERLQKSILSKVRQIQLRT
jgi:hypothetical protein